MNVEYIDEPHLEFGDKHTHIDIRFGLASFRPFDNAFSPLSEINLGIIGTSETLEGCSRWIARCRNGIPAKTSRQPKLFPPFPGFGENTNLPVALRTETSFHRQIRAAAIEKLKKFKHVNEVVLQVGQLFLEEIEYLAQNKPVHVVICALPASVLDMIDDLRDAARKENHKARIFDLHDYIKAKAMRWRIHTQLIRPSTYDESKVKRQKHKPEKAATKQDEATRAWNFYTALYYKAQGVPWRLVRDEAQLTTCYVGISFYRVLEGDELQTSIAQVFNERGDGVIVKGAVAKLSSEDRQPHLATDDAKQLLVETLQTYRREHRNFPARIVIHKSSQYNEDEVTGFLSALDELSIDAFDFLSLSESGTKLFRVGGYPPLRGTFLTLDATSHVLYTRGSVKFFETYPGDYVPNPLYIHCERIEQTPRFLAEEILGLTKMNWNKTQFDGLEPITLLAAGKVGKILKYVGDGDLIQPRYSFYM